MLTRKFKGPSRSAALSLVFKTKFLLLVFTSLFLSVGLASAQTGLGIGSFDLRTTSDIGFAFDYNDTGMADHIVFYRPGTGVIQIIGIVNGTWTTVYSSTTGIGGYDLSSTSDRIVPFDYDGKGYVDHLLLYRPGTGKISILANMHGTFMPVYAGGDGIGGFDLMSTNDVIAPFDYNSSGLSDHLVAYRPGTGIVYILQNMNGSFTPMYQGGNGIGGYDLASTNDRVVAFDYYGTGAADHLLMYRPGDGIVQIIENQNGSFVPMFQSTSGIGGYDLRSPADRILPFDYSGLGVLDHLLVYRPGTGFTWIMSSAYFNFNVVYQSTTGIGGYDVMSTTDQGFALNAGTSGLLPNLVFYRPGTGTIYILGTSANSFTPIFMDMASAQFGMGRTTLPMNP